MKFFNRLKTVAVSAMLMAGGILCAPIYGNGPGYLDFDGSARYMSIPHNPAFDVAAGGSIT